MTESIQRGLYEPTRDIISNWLMYSIMDFEKDLVVFTAGKPDSKSIQNLMEMGKVGGGISCCFCGKILEEDIVAFLLFNKTYNSGIGCNLCGSCADEASKFMLSVIKNAIRIDTREFARKYDVGFQISLGGVK